MNDDQYRELKRMIAELGMRVEEMRLDAKRREKLADHRFSLLYEWCAPADYKTAVSATTSDEGETLDAFLDRIKTR